MWLTRITNYLMENRWQTIAIVFLITFLPVIGILGILIAALVTFRKGVLEGSVLAIAATLPFIISFYLTGKHTESTPEIVVWAAVSVAVLSNVMTWVFAVMLRRNANWSLVLQVGALVGVLAVSVIHLLYPNVADWWAGQLQAYYAQAQEIAGVKKPIGNGEAQLETINLTKQYATGLMVAGILFNATLQLMVARWWLAAVYMPGLLRRELHNIRLSQLAGVLFIVSLVLSYLGNSVVLDIMPILYILFGAAGLSLIHYLFGLIGSKTRWFWMLLLYFTLILALPTSIVLVAILALIDIWADMRKRVNKI